MARHVRQDNLTNFVPISRDRLFVVDMRKNDRLESIQTTTKGVVLIIPEEIETDKCSFEKKVRNVVEYICDINPEMVFYFAMNNPYSLHAFCGETDKNGVLFPMFFENNGKQGKNYLSYVDLCNIVNNACTRICNKHEINWHYPYPNIDNVLCIYSDQYLPRKGECIETYYNLEQPRWEFFDETYGIDQIVEAGLYRQFANSYLLSVNAVSEEQVLYTRFSNERRSQLQIQTSILRKNGKQYVEKKAISPLGNAHIRNLDMSKDQLDKQLDGICFWDKNVVCNKIGEQLDGRALFEFVEGESLEYFIDQEIGTGNVQKARKCIQDLCNLVKNQFETVPFERTEDFTNVFGTCDLETMEALPVMNIDMIPQNILLGEKATIIDYEWTFHFPIPRDYLIYRILFFTLEFKNRKEMLGQDLYEQFGIDKDKQILFSKMETNFQKYVQHDVEIYADYCNKNSKAVLRKEDLFNSLEKMRDKQIQIVYKNEVETREELLDFKYNKKRVMEFALDLSERSVSDIILKLPFTNVLLRVNAMQEQNGESVEAKFQTSGVCIHPLIYLFEDVCEITFQDFGQDIHKLYIGLEPIEISSEMAREISKNINDMEFVIANREEQLNDLKNSLSWKVTKPLRKIKGTDRE